MITQENKVLNDFWKDSAMKDTVHIYLVEYLKKEVVRLAFEEKEVKGAVLAKESIDAAFTNLDDTFEPKPKVSGTNSPR